MNGTGLARGFGCVLAGLVLTACQDSGQSPADTDSTSGSETSAGSGTSASTGSDTTSGGTTTLGGTETDPDAGSGTSSSGATECSTPVECAMQAEDRTGSTLEDIRDDVGAVKAFLVDMPLGGDLHHHLSGSVYAETYLAWAQQEEDDYCITEAGLALSASCGDGNDVPVPSGRRDLYLDVVRAWSMYEFVPSPSESGADHFFATFSKFGIISGREHGRMLADVRRRAAAQNLLYIEPMLTSNSTARSLGQDVWASLGGGSLTPSDFAPMHAALLADPGFAAARARLTEDADNSETVANAEQNCGTGSAAPGCSVRTRYQAYISRSGTDSGVFAQMVAAYEAAIVEPRIVGLNLVGPEDGSTAMANYDDQMAMLEYLGDYYADTSPLRLSLHAGEITAQSIPDGYALDEEDHIRKAVQIAGARRIGHGVDVMFESDAEGLMDLLRDEGVLVEVCLASNDIILEVSGPTHPIHDYLERGIPVALATDDQGVARSSLADEFVRGVVDQELSYRELKLMVRASLEYSFLPGPSLWSDMSGGVAVDACAPSEGDTVVTQPPSDTCQAFLEGSERAQLQRLLESQLEAFEAEF